MRTRPTPGLVKLQQAAVYLTLDLEVCRISDSPSFHILQLHLKQTSLHICNIRCVNSIECLAIRSPETSQKL